MSKIEYASFWKHRSFVVVGHSAKRPFPRLTYRGLKKLGKRVFAVDPFVESIEGDMVFTDLGALPCRVDAAVLEVPPDETESRVAEVAAAGIADVWIHMGTETPQALALAQREGIRVRSGSCAVMYLEQRPSYHSIHKWVRKLARSF